MNDRWVTSFHLKTNVPSIFHQAASILPNVYPDVKNVGVPTTNHPRIYIGVGDLDGGEESQDSLEQRNSDKTDI